MTMIQRMFSIACKAPTILALATVIPLLTACGPSPDDALLQQAKTGDPIVQDALALAYSNLEQYGKAVQWWTRAAKQGHAPAQVNLGLMYHAGTGTSRDLVEARRWYQAAAEQGDADGQHNLALLYRRGEGGKRNASKAAAWYLQAAQQGRAISMTELGEMYAAGEGVPQDQAQALSWWRKAASHGHSGGWVHLADAYARGDGVSPNRELAYAMLQRAEASGLEGRSAEWYEQIESQREALLAFGLGHFTLMEHAKQLEREGQVDAALADPPSG
ncbi:tetratricopeptide repeat protein [Phytopseudomonas dryadis]|uniref:Sel1 repeat family protein n=1 Tax=Phytopseudomonas dryadis TaxID=2487520 RepID=A0A4Q9QWQ9_9GAMM|nr:tetratricopeptide repeat protein [Pseudomonas dryadis]TBU86943.1 sel1 repeat family protein [Pseudomonas dryadis]